MRKFNIDEMSLASTKILHNKVPINHLDQHLKNVVAGSAQITTHAKGEILFKTASSHKRTLAYLLWGKMRFYADDGFNKVIQHQDYSSAYAISKLKHFRVEILRANTLIVWLNKNLVKECIKTQIHLNNTIDNISKPEEEPVIIQRYIAALSTKNSSIHQKLQNYFQQQVIADH